MSTRAAGIADLTARHERALETAIQERDSYTQELQLAEATHAGTR